MLYTCVQKRAKETYTIEHYSCHLAQKSWKNYTKKVKEGEREILLQTLLGGACRKVQILSFAYNWVLVGDCPGNLYFMPNCRKNDKQPCTPLSVREHVKTVTIQRICSQCCGVVSAHTCHVHASVEYFSNCERSNSMWNITVILRN